MGITILDPAGLIERNVIRSHLRFGVSASTYAIRTSGDVIRESGIQDMSSYAQSGSDGTNLCSDFEC